VNANHIGNFISVVYASPPRPDRQAEEIFRMLEESGVACCRIQGKPA
jgi:hypothetical protein